MATMSDVFSVVVEHGSDRVSVSAPDAEWVERMARDFIETLSRLPAAAAPPAGSIGRAVDDDATRQAQVRSRSRPRSASRSRANPELEARLTKELRAELEQYIEERSAAWSGSQPAQAAILAAFLADKLDWGGVDAGDLYTLYTAMGWRLPGNIRSQLLNAQQRAGFFRGARDGKYELSHAGENFGRHESRDVQIG